MAVNELAEPVRRDWGGIPEGKLSPRAPRHLIGRGRARGGVPRPMGLGLGKHRDESHMRTLSVTPFECSAFCFLGTTDLLLPPLLVMVCL